MNRGQSNFNGGNSNNLAQMTADLNNLGLDPNTLKKLSMSGIREFIPPSTSSSMGGSGPGNGMNLRGSDNSGSNSPYGQNFGGPPMSTASRLQVNQVNIVRLKIKI